MKVSGVRRLLHFELSTGSRRFLASAGFACLVLAVLGFIVHRVLPEKGLLQIQVVLSALGLGVGCLLAALDLGYVALFRRTVRWALLAIVVSQLGYHVLVWSSWKTQSIPWRVWWVAMVASLHLTHVVLLRAARRRHADLWSLTAIASAALAALLWASLALRPGLLGSVPAPWWWLLAASALVTVLSSMVVLWRDRGLAEVRWIPSPPWRRALLVLSHLVLLAAGIYLGRVGVDDPAPVKLPSALAHLPAAEVEAQVDADLQRLRTVVAGLATLEQEMAEHRQTLRERCAAQGREYLLPEEDDTLRWQFVTYLSYRSALLRQVATYSGFEALRDPVQRARCFMLGYAAAMVVYRSGLDLVEGYVADPVQRRKLNEPEPAWGIPAGMFDRIYTGVSAERHVELCEEMAAHFEHRRAEWRRQQVLAGDDFTWLAGEIDASLASVRQRRVSAHRRWLDLFVEKARQDTYTPVYAVQSMVAEWIGDVRIVDRPRFITPELIAEIRSRLEPGDILLERRSWNASNAFLPGFWPHAALYVGTMDDLQRLGIEDHPEVRSRRDAYLAPGPDGHHNTVIEALAEGVIFNTAEHSLHADYVAVLRPRLDQARIAEAITRAFRHQGKPYDFEFDFFTSDRLVCTELVYRAYAGMLDFELTHVMGRDTLPAIELVRTFATRRRSRDRQLDFVLFVDAEPGRGAFFSDEDAFVASAERMREFNEESSLRW